MGVAALAVELGVPELPDVLVTVDTSEGALAVKLTVPELPDIYPTAGPGLSA